MAPRATPAGTDTDEQLLARLPGIELAAATVEEAVAASPLLDPATAALVAALAAHHRTHAAAWTEEGAEPDASADAGALAVLFPAVVAAADGPSLLAAALAVEQAMAATAGDACARLGDRHLAALAARIGAVEARHRAVLGVATGAPLDAGAPPVTAATEASLL